jgi:hypothetical protein
VFENKASTLIDKIYQPCINKIGQDLLDSNGLIVDTIKSKLHKRLTAIIYKRTKNILCNDKGVITLEYLKRITSNVFNSYFRSNKYSLIDSLESCIQASINKNEICNLKISNDDKNTWLNHTNRLHRRGLFDISKSRCDEDYLDNYHKISIDPNNDSMIYGVSETGKVLEFTKGYYNDISKINVVKQRMKRYIKKDNMANIYQKMSSNGYKTIKEETYLEYARVILDNWNQIWDFYGQQKILNMKLTRFIESKKAIHKICRKIVKKRKYRTNLKFKTTKNPYEMTNINDILKKPILIFFGKGNGSISISNLKGKDSHGPIKKIAYELSKLCPVILSDEYRTSQLCNLCQDYIVDHPSMKQLKINLQKIDRDKIILTGDEKKSVENKEKSDNLYFDILKQHHQLVSNEAGLEGLNEQIQKSEELTKRLTESVTKIEMIKDSISKAQKMNKIEEYIDKIRNEEDLNKAKQLKKKLEKKYIELNYKKITTEKYKKCHKLCVCKNDSHFDNLSQNKHKIWNRDYNAARNISTVTTLKLLGKNIGNFSAKVKKEEIISKHTNPRDRKPAKEVSNNCALVDSKKLSRIHSTKQSKKAKIKIKIKLYGSTKTAPNNNLKNVIQKVSQ